MVIGKDGPMYELDMGSLKVHCDTVWVRAGDVCVCGGVDRGRTESAPFVPFFFPDPHAAVRKGGHATS